MIAETTFAIFCGLIIAARIVFDLARAWKKKRQLGDEEKRAGRGVLPSSSPSGRSSDSPRVRSAQEVHDLLDRHMAAEFHTPKE